MQEEKHFGWFKRLFWPIHNDEYRKLVPIFCLFFLISVVYHLLRNMKIALIITLKDSGANTIPFLKVGCVLPGAILITYIFTRLVAKYPREKVFYCLVAGFVSYFVIFTFILFPNQSSLELTYFANLLKKYVFVADGFNGLISVVRHWNISLFYVISELWSTVVLSMLAWGLANEITKMNEAKRFYVVFGIGVNSAGIFMGIFANWMSGLYLPKITMYADNYQWVFYQLLLVLFISSIIICIYYYFNNHVLSEHDRATIVQKKPKHRISLMECFRFLMYSRYLIYIVMIILSYNIVFNLADVIWSYRVKILYTNSKDFYAYLNQVTMITGIIATAFGGLISGTIIRKFGWRISALVTPFVWLITGIMFYSCIIIENIGMMDILATFISNPANIILLLGTLQISLGRACKYTIFDATKEMTFIPMSKDEQRKSKAVVDGIASRLGKSFGSIFYITLLLIFGNIADTIPFVAAFIFTLIVIWVYSVIKLGRLSAKLHQEYRDI